MVNRKEISSVKKQQKRERRKINKELREAQNKFMSEEELSDKLHNKATEIFKTSRENSEAIRKTIFLSDGRDITKLNYEKDEEFEQALSWAISQDEWEGYAVINEDDAPENSEWERFLAIHLHFLSPINKRFFCAAPI